MERTTQKHLAFYHHHELRVQQLDDNRWGSSCEIIRDLIWDTTTCLDLACAQRCALVTAQNLLTQYPLLKEVNWRDLSEDGDEVWLDRMKAKNHPGYLRQRAQQSGS